VKKKHFATSKDKKDWIRFTKQMGNISVKESDLPRKNTEINKVQKLDLHGSSLVEANEMVKNFIIKSFNDGYKKLLVVTGKGSRSKSYDNPYLSEKLSTLKYSVPEYIKNDENLNKKISRIVQADLKDGGEGAIYIFLKNNNKFTE
jgi:DNA-nicking Smr family endonuclease